MEDWVVVFDLMWGGFEFCFGWVFFGGCGVCNDGVMVWWGFVGGVGRFDLVLVSDVGVGRIGKVESVLFFRDSCLRGVGCELLFCIGG